MFTALKTHKNYNFPGHKSCSNIQIATLQLYCFEQKLQGSTKLDLSCLNHVIKNEAYTNLYWICFP